MIEHFEHYVWIGIAQVSFIALLGSLVATVMIRIKGSVAAPVGCAVLLVIAVLTLSMPIPLPNWLSLSDSPVVEQYSGSDAMVAKDGSKHVAAEHEPQAAGSTFLNLSRLLQRIVLIKTTPEPSNSYATVKPIVFTMMAAFVAFGVLKFTVGMIGSRRLVITSKPLVDERAARIAKSVCDVISLQQSVRLVESDRINGAAVAGWLRPTILLPQHWRSWTEEQLQSVLAHELAHVARGDYVWRIASCVMTSIHYYNPFVHLFVRRLALAQEITADTLAAGAVGRSKYVRALSTLALQADETGSCFTQAGVHPVFSGYLIRRIKMLNSKRNWTEAGSATTFKWAGISAILIVGGITLASRGIAQPPETKQVETKQVEASPVETKQVEASPVERVASRSIRKQHERVDPTQGMFGRERTDLSSFRENKAGFLMVSLAEILRILDSEGAVASVSQLTSEGLGAWLSTDVSPTLNLSLVESICGPFVVSTRSMQARDSTAATVGGEGLIAGAVSEETTNEGRRNTLSLGISRLQVECNQPVDISEWVSRHAPSVEAIDHGAAGGYLLPVLPALGPTRIAVANRDPQTICFSNFMLRAIPEGGIPDTIATLSAMVDHQPSPNRSAWAAAFGRIDGGLISMVATDNDIKTPEEFTAEFDSNRLANEVELTAAKAFHSIEHKFETLAIGIDISEDARTMGVRIRIGCENRKDTSQIHSDVETLIQMYRKEILESDPDVLDSNAAALAVLRPFINRAVIDFVDNIDGTSDVYIRSTIDLPASSGSLLAQMIAEDFAESQE